jgi:hypothetical protein
VEFVGAAGLDTGDEGFPDPGFSPRLHGMGIGVPFIEVPYDGNALRIWRPDAEPCALNTLSRAKVTPEVVVKAKVTPFIEQIKIAIAEK